MAAPLNGLDEAAKMLRQAQHDCRLFKPYWFTANSLPETKMSSSTTVLVEITPVWGLNAASYVKLPDSAYGELLIYQANEPVFYLYIFDEIYQEVLPKFEQSSLSLTSLAQKSFAVHKLPYTTTQTIFGFKGNPVSEVITLEKYPARYLLNAF